MTSHTPLTAPDTAGLGAIVDALTNSAMQALAQELRRQGSGTLGDARPLRAAVREIVRRTLRNVADLRVTSEAPTTPEPEPPQCAPPISLPGAGAARSQSADIPPVSALSVSLVVPPRQACRMLAIGLTKLYELLNAGELESYLHGGSRRITVASVNAYVARRLAAGKASPRSHP